MIQLLEQPNEIDDGLFTSSEVAQLKLSVGWVVLSACNTIAAKSRGAEALSGLARAFFYAGVQALLVLPIPQRLRSSHAPAGRLKSFQWAFDSRFAVPIFEETAPPYGVIGRR